MSLFRTDPLLAFCRLLSWFILISVCCGCVLALCASAATLVNGDFVVKALRLSYPQLREEGLRLPFFLAMIFIAIGLALIARFMMQLLAIIRTVPTDEAFTLANAGRIRAMAWISLIGMPVGFCIFAALTHVAAHLGPRAADAGIRIEAPSEGFGYNQVLMTLLLFVLARLFAQAAAMRDEIEGTV